MNDIEVLEEFIKCDNIFIQIDKLKTSSINEAIENLLKERQSDKERIKHLEEETDLLIGQNEWYKDYYDCESIPKSLIKEKIEEIKEKIEEAELEKDVTLYSFIYINQIKMRALEELLNTKM